MKILRLIPRNITKNEVETTYRIESFSLEDTKNLLSLENVGGGVVGFEYVKTKFGEKYYFFSPPHFKVNLEKCNRDGIFDKIKENDKNISVAQFKTEKQSMFPLNMNYSESMWSIIKETVPNHINILYQAIMLHKHDNWKEKLKEEYSSYLDENIQSPFQNKLLRNIQAGINESFNSLFKFEHKNLPIKEFDDKINQNGFRYSIRLCLIGGTKKQRKKCINQIKEKLNKYSYTNNWNIYTPLIYGDILQDIQQRKLDKLTRNQVLCESEILPFITNESNIVLESKIEKTEEVTTNIAEPKESNLFDLLPKSNKKYKDVNIDSYVSNFKDSLKQLGIKKELNLKHYQYGSTILQLTFELPKGVTLSSLTKKPLMEDLKVYMGIKELNILQNKEAGCIDVQFPLEERRTVYLGDYINHEGFQEFSKNSELGFIVGLSVGGDLIYRDFADFPHGLTIGASGSGKSKFINMFLLTLFLTKKSNDLKVYLIDIKQVEFTKFKDFPHVQSVITDSDVAVETLKQIHMEVNRRYKLLSEKGVENLYEYNKKSKDKLSRILIVIDEYNDLKMRNKDIDDYVLSFAQLARACGVHVYVATQRSDVTVIDGKIKANLNTKIVFRCNGTRNYTTALSKAPEFSLLGKGDGILEDDTGEQTRFQSLLIADEFEGDIIKKIGKNLKENNNSSNGIAIEAVNPELEELKSVIANTGETRVGELRKIMKININKLNGFMNDLVEEGWLEKGKSRQEGFKLIANDEELNKYKK